MAKAVKTEVNGLKKGGGQDGKCCTRRTRVCLALSSQIGSFRKLGVPYYHMIIIIYYLLLRFYYYIFWGPYNQDPTIC